MEFGERWLDDLDFICIDPKRTPNIAREFESIDYQVDRDGNPKPRLEDKILSLENRNEELENLVEQYQEE